MNPSNLARVFKEMGCLPHQAEFAASFLSPASGTKHLLTSPPGMGKSFVAGAIASHIISSSPGGRIIVLAPAALLVQWQEVILRFKPGAAVLVVDRLRFRELEDSRAVSGDVWPANSIVIMSIDFAKKDEIAASLIEAHWDCLIVDEVHRTTIQNQRGKMIAELIDRWPETRVLFLQVGGVASADAEAPSSLLDGVAVTVWSRDGLRDLDGKPLLPESRIEWISHRRKLDEIAVLVRLQESLKTLAASRDELTWLVIVVLLQSASSSLFALEQRLRRILQRRNEMVHGATREMDAEFETELGEIPESWSVANTDMLFAHLKAIARPILEMLEEVASDSKCEALLHTLYSLHFEEINKQRACVLTRFADTASYLQSALTDSIPQVRAINGSLESDERARIVAEFSQDGGVLIATEAVAECFLPEVGVLVFYDLPLSPVILDQLIGRFVRIGHKGLVRVFAFSDESDSVVIEGLQREIAESKRSLSKSEIENKLFSTVR